MIQFKKLMNGRALYQEPNKIWVAKGRHFFAVDYNGQRKSRVFTVPGGLKERLMTCGRILTQGTRNDIRILLPLKNGNILIAAKRKVLVFSPSGKVVNIWTDFQGNKPGHQGACVTPDGTVFFTEYLLNPKRDHAIRLWRSKDHGMTWQIVKEFIPGDIRHLHFIKWDTYAKCLWMGTGDYGEGGCENRLYQSKDNGDTWRMVGQGSQDWRAIGVCMTEMPLPGEQMPEVVLTPYISYAWTAKLNAWRFWRTWKGLAMAWLRLQTGVLSTQQALKEEKMKKTTSHA